MTNSRLRVSLSAIVAVQLLLACHAVAADQMILGKKFYLAIFASSLADPLNAKLTVSAKELTSPNTIVGDPVANGGFLRAIVSNGSDTDDQTFAMPAVGWTVLGTKGFKYTDPAAGGDTNPVYKAIIKRSASGTFAIKVLLRRTVFVGGLDLQPFANPTTAGIILTLSGGDNYCVEFAGVGGTVSHNSGSHGADFLRIVRPTAEACPQP